MIVAAAVGIFLVTYAFIATEKVHRVAAALGGVAAMTLVGLVDADTAFFDQETGIDWNVIFLLFGMMVIVGILKHTGLFEYLALWAANARGRPARLLVLLILVTAVASPVLDNVTTVLLVAPVTLRCVPARAAGRAVPDLAGVRVEHRRHGHADRRPAEHHHRQPRRPDVQRLPRPLALPIAVVLVAVLVLLPVAVPQGVRVDGELVDELDGPRPRERDHRPAAAGPVPGRARAW